MGNNTANTSYGTNPTVNCKVIESEPGVQIFQNAEGEQFEKYIIPCQPNLQNTYEFRVKHQHPQLVDLLYAGQPKGLTCNSPPNIVVITERIPYRLMHLPPQQSYNALTILHSSLLGFKDLFRQNQLFCIRDSMIGISAKHKVKVWMNPNFAINTPEPLPHSFSILEASQYEKEMVQNIFDLVNSKAENSSIWRQLIYARQRRDLHTFDQALSLLQDFSHSQRITIGEEVRNPFNKNMNQKDDYNSQIDKLEELKNRGLNEGEQERRQLIGYLGQERRPGGNIQMIKQKIINPGPVVSTRNVQHGDPRDNRIQRHPFRDIQRGMRGVSQSGTTFYSHLPSSTGMEHNSYHITAQHSPAIRTFSPSKPLSVKFRYQGQQPINMTPAVRFHPPSQPAQVSNHIQRVNEQIQQQNQHIKHRNRVDQICDKQDVAQPTNQKNVEDFNAKAEANQEEVSKETSIRRYNHPSQTDQTIIDVLGDMKQDEKNILENFESPKQGYNEQFQKRTRNYDEKRQNFNENYVQRKQNDEINQNSSYIKEEHQHIIQSENSKKIKSQQISDNNQPHLITSNKSEQIPQTFFASNRSLNKKQDQNKYFHQKQNSRQEKHSEQLSPQRRSSSKYEIVVKSPELSHKEHADNQNETQIHPISSEVIQNNHPLFHVRQAQSINNDIPVLTQAAINKLTEQFFPQAKKTSSIVENNTKSFKKTTQSSLGKRQLPTHMTTSQQIKNQNPTSRKNDQLKAPKDKISQTVPSPRSAKINSLLESKGKLPKISYKDMRKLLLQTMDDC